MGEKFNFLNWCDSWLLTSGINTIEPITEYNPNGSLKRLEVLQIVEKAGQNRLRKSKIDIALYD